MLGALGGGQMIVGIFLVPCACEVGERDEQWWLCTWPQTLTLALLFALQFVYLAVWWPFASTIQQVVEMLGCLCNVLITSLTFIAWFLPTQTPAREGIADTIVWLTRGIYLEVLLAFYELSFALWIVAYTKYVLPHKLSEANKVLKDSLHFEAGRQDNGRAATLSTTPVVELGQLNAHSQTKQKMEVPQEFSEDSGEHQHGSTENKDGSAQPVGNLNCNPLYLPLYTKYANGR